MLPKGTLILLIGGLTIWAGSVVSARLFAGLDGAPPAWIKLPALIVAAVGVLIFVMGLYGVGVGIADAIRSRRKSEDS